jgi:hypothetical protein
MTAFMRNPFIGVGVSLRKQMDSTNLIFVTLGESGVVGLISFLTIQLVYILLVVRLVKALPRTDPRFFLIVVSPTLMSVRLAHAQFDHYWVRGATTMAWVSVGFVLAAVANEKRRLGSSNSRLQQATSRAVTES